MESYTRRVAVLLFDEVEALDFCGPLEVFGTVGKGGGGSRFEVYTVAETEGPIMSAGNLLSINPRYSFAEYPAPDILVVPGGIGTRREMKNPRMLDWLRGLSASVEVLLSVCTGALLLGSAGLLKGMRATTHASALELLREVAPEARVLDGERYVDNGKIVLSAGISAGMDASLHVVARLQGEDEARAVARHMEYAWTGPIPFAEIL